MATLIDLVTDTQLLPSWPIYRPLHSEHLHLSRQCTSRDIYRQFGTGASMSDAADVVAPHEAK